MLNIATVMLDQKVLDLDTFSLIPLSVLAEVRTVEQMHIVVRLAPLLGEMYVPLHKLSPEKTWRRPTQVGSPACMPPPTRCLHATREPVLLTTLAPPIIDPTHVTHFAVRPRGGAGVTAEMSSSLFSQGEFGAIFQAEMAGAAVACKLPFKVDDWLDLTIQEILTLGKLPPHPAIVPLYGITLKLHRGDIDLFLLMEVRRDRERTVG